MSPSLDAPDASWPRAEARSVRPVDPPVKYDWVAPFYDVLAAIYSAGGIRRAKLEHVRFLDPGCSALYVGAGSGEECVAAALRGVEVTVIDQSPRMLERCARRLARAQVEARLVAGDALSARTEQFDVIVAPFFLNVFSESALPNVCVHLASMLTARGRLISVDFRAPVRSAPLSFLQRVYYLPPLSLFYLTCQNPWHPLYDYEAVIKRCEPSLELRENFTHRAWGLPLLQTLIWTKRSSPWPGAHSS